MTLRNPWDPMVILAIEYFYGLSVDLDRSDRVLEPKYQVNFSLSCPSMSHFELFQNSWLSDRHLKISRIENSKLKKFSFSKLVFEKFRS